MNAQRNATDQAPGQNGSNGRPCRKAYNRAVSKARAVFSLYPTIRNADLAPDDYLIMAAGLDPLGVK